MIRDTLHKNQSAALTSTEWHVVHARWNGSEDGAPVFDRTIVSEHPDRGAARTAARSLGMSISESMKQRPLERRDQVLVRRPEFCSLKQARRVVKRAT